MSGYKCDKCGTEFTTIDAGQGREVVNRDPYTVQFYVTCPHCGSDEIEETDYYV